MFMLELTNIKKSKKSGMKTKYGDQPVFDLCEDNKEDHIQYSSCIWKGIKTKKVTNPTKGEIVKPEHTGVTLRI